MRSPRRDTNGSSGPATPVIKVGIYCRKSVDESNGNGAFNSTQAQAEACLNYIAAQKDQGWIAHSETFVDSGISGGTLDRPALQKLLSEVEAGHIQVVIVYRADRLSRRILDFLQLVEQFDKHGVAFVSVTEQFNTSTPGGRLYQHMLLSFAQYERELIAERTRHKIHAARRKGKFTGGGLVLGYDRHPDGGKLVLNPGEADRVRTIFRLFLETGSLVGTVQELNSRGWTLKRWTTKQSRSYGGGRFDVHSLRRMLTNHAYVGEVAFDGQVVPAEHESIVDRQTWDRVQEVMAERRHEVHHSGRPSTALLAGILRCAPCDAAMTPTYSGRNGRRYRYYCCLSAHKRGWASCPSKSVPAREVEAFVVEKIRAIGRDPELVERTVEASRPALTSRRKELEAEVRRLQEELDDTHATMRKAMIGLSRNALGQPRPPTPDQREDVQRIEDALTAARRELEALRGQRIDADHLRAALYAFDPVWEHLTSPERARVVHLLIERIDYDGGSGSLKITFAPAGVRTLAAEGGK